MKYRVRLDLAFDLQDDAQKLVDYAKTLMDKATSINVGEKNQETSYLELELCGHDEGLPCTHLERVEK